MQRYNELLEKKDRSEANFDSLHFNSSKKAAETPLQKGVSRLFT